MKKVVRSLVDALLVLVLVGLVPFAWILRDGLGPDSSASSGLDAVSRCFMTFYSGPILIVLALSSAILRSAWVKAAPQDSVNPGALDSD